MYDQDRLGYQALIDQLSSRQRSSLTMTAFIADFPYFRASEPRSNRSGGDLPVSVRVRRLLPELGLAGLYAS